MSSTNEVFIAPSNKLAELLQSRLEESKTLLFSFIWILLLLLHFHISLLGLSILSVFYAGLRERPFLNIAINLVTVLIVLLFFQNHPSFLKKLSNREKLAQILLSVITILSAVAVIYAAALQFGILFGMNWFGDLWLFATFFSMIVACGIVFIAFGKKYLKSAIPHSMILIIAESSEIINILRDTSCTDKYVKKLLKPHHRRFWIYFDAFILGYKQFYSALDIYEIFLKPAGMFFDIQESARYSFDRKKLLDKWEKLITNLQEKFSIPVKGSYRINASTQANGRPFEILTKSAIEKFDSFLLITPIEYYFPFLRTLWNASYMPVNSPSLGRITLEKSIKKNLRAHLEQAREYDLLIAGNDVIAFFFILLGASLTTFLEFMFSAYKLTESDRYTNAFGVTCFVGGSYLLINAGLKRIQRRVRADGANFFINPIFYSMRHWVYNFMSIGTIFLIHPLTAKLVNIVFGPSRSIIMILVYVTISFFIIIGYWLPDYKVKGFGISLLIRELFYLISYLYKSKRIEYRWLALRSLSYCTKLLKYLEKEGHDNYSDREQRLAFKIFFESIKKHLGKIGYKIRLGSESSRASTIEDVVIITKSILEKDYLQIQEQIPDIQSYINSAISMKQPSVLGRINHIINSSWLLKTSLLVFFYLILNRYLPPNIWNILQDLSSLASLLFH